MTVSFKLGKCAAVDDPRVPSFSAIASSLPLPPVSVDWYDAVSNWGMLGNDSVGDCVEAAVGHAILQMSTFAGSPKAMTTPEALGFYSAATGYQPGNPATDNGSYVLGQGGVMQFWHRQGVTAGDTLNKVTAFVGIRHKVPQHWQQGIYIFGGILLGLQVPASLMAGDSVPPVWSDAAGPSAGGHEIWINGYETIGGTTFYDLISWGHHYRATQEFLLKTMDEAVAVYDLDSISGRGVNAAGFNSDQLVADMSALRNEG